ncbi:hypothetical protein RQP46_006191 [Phenoliferia psychrophenolica]
MSQTHQTDDALLVAGNTFNQASHHLQNLLGTALPLLSAYAASSIEPSHTPPPLEILTHELPSLILALEASRAQLASLSENSHAGMFGIENKLDLKRTRLQFPSTSNDVVLPNATLPLANLDFFSAPPARRMPAFEASSPWNHDSLESKPSSPNRRSNRSSSPPAAPSSSSRASRSARRCRPYPSPPLSPASSSTTTISSSPTTQRRERRRRPDWYLEEHFEHTGTHWVCLHAQCKARRTKSAKAAAVLVAKGQTPVERREMGSYRAPAIGSSSITKRAREHTLSHQAVEDEDEIEDADGGDDESESEESRDDEMAELLLGFASGAVEETASWE